MKRINSMMSCAVLLSLFSLTACGPKQTKLDTPQNVTYDVSTGKFSFDAVKGGDTYVVGVSLILNDTTGEKLKDINSATQVTLPDGSTKWVWSNQMGSVTGLADDDGDGKVEGTIVYRTFSSSATDSGTPINAADIPASHYVLQVVASATSELGSSDPAMYTFTKEGQLKSIDGATASIDPDNHINITVPAGNSSPFGVSVLGYYIDALTTSGLPDKIEAKVNEEGEVKETIEMDDFSFTNTVNGPMKIFNFNEATFKGTATLDPTKKHTVTLQAIGSDGVTSSDISNAYFATSTAETTYATKYDCSGTGTAGKFTVNINVGVDSDSKQIYGLEAKIGSAVIYRESGTYTIPDGVTVSTEEDKTTYPDKTVLTFTTTSSDLDTPIMNGKTLTVTKTESQGWGGPSVSWGLLGTGFSLDGTSFDFTGAASSNSGFPGGPM